MERFLRFFRSALIVLGGILIIAAILFWTVGLNILLKVPGDIDLELEYEGEVTWYVNPATMEALPEGEEITQTLKASRQGISLDEEYDSSTAVVKETVVLTVAGMDQEPLLAVYTVDRNDMKNVADDRAYAFEESIKVDRSGAYYPLLPFGVSKEGDYPLWKNEVNSAFPVVYIDEGEKEGLGVYNFKVGFEKEPVWEPFLKVLDLPVELSFDDFKAQLSTSGIDVDGLMALASQVLTPEDLQALMQAAAESISINYYWDFYAEASVEPTSGLLVDLYINQESISMQPDYSGLMDLFSILMKYREDPVLGPALEQLAALQSQMEAAEPQRILGYDYAQTADSVSEAVEDAKDTRGLINMVKLWLPLIMVIVGALLLLGGVIWLLIVPRS